MNQSWLASLIDATRGCRLAAG